MIVPVFAEPGAPSVRPPAVAGQFYPASPKELRAQINRFLAIAPKSTAYVSLLISPHAGYVFSAPVAAYGFNRIDPETKTVFILGPAHHHWFKGVAIADVGAYQTPLGSMPLDQNIIAQLRKSSLVQVVEQADAPEHSVEVQVPFLQVVCPKASIVPIVCGDVRPQAVADLIAPFISENAVVIASSDFSHYHSSAEARIIDHQSIATILGNDIHGALDACGEIPIRAVMILATAQKLTPKLLDARNSGETALQYQSDKVVGYASIVFELPAHTSQADDDGIPVDLRQWLLALARRSLDAAVNKRVAPRPETIPAKALEKSGCFVTLTEDDNLRGCIGYIEPVMPLYEAVIENAANAALHDGRFVPVKPDELPLIAVEISVLTRPEPLLFSSPQELLDKLKPGVHGVIIRRGRNQSTFLPQVWEQLTDKVEFLQHLSLKAGMDADGWKESNVQTYRAIHFSE